MRRRLGGFAKFAKLLVAWRPGPESVRESEGFRFGGRELGGAGAVGAAGAIVARGSEFYFAWPQAALGALQNLIA